MAKNASLFSTLGLFLSVGCAVGPVYQRPNMNMQAAYAVQMADMADALSADLGWWEIVNDDVVLKSLVLDAIEKNHDLRTALSRMKEARETSGINQLSPDVNGNARTSYSDASGSKGKANFTTGLSASWEVDIWGKVRHGQEASLAQYLASEQGRRAVFLTLIGDVVNGYYQLQSLDMKLATAKRTVASRKESLALMQKRMDLGVGEMMETNQAQASLAQAEASIPPLELSIHLQENKLNLLLGRMPGPIPRGSHSLQAIAPRMIDPGLPSELLERRPDIRQKEELLKATNSQVGVAEASRFPSFSLTGSLGLASPTLAGLVTSSSQTFSLGGGLLAPIVDGGRLSHQKNAAVERFEQARLAYEKTVLAAFCEVSNSLMSVAKSRDIVKAQEHVLKTLRESERLAKLKYEYGAATYLQVIDAERQLFSAELSFAEALCDQQSHLIKLYLSLGGGWKQPDRPKEGA